MEILIPLPSNSSINTYKELKNYLKQFELAIHYAQKTVESAEANEMSLTEDAYVCFKHPSLDEEMRDNKYEELQNVELNISIN